MRRDTRTRLIRAFYPKPVLRNSTSNFGFFLFNDIFALFVARAGSTNTLNVSNGSMNPPPPPLPHSSLLLHPTSADQSSPRISSPAAPTYPEKGYLILHTDVPKPPDDYPSIFRGADAGPGEGEQFFSNLSSSSTPPIDSDLCLDVSDGSVENGAVLTLEECDGGDSQV